MRRTIVELLHIVTGVIGTGVVGYGASWSLPHAAPTIWNVAFVGMVVIVLMGLRPLRLAWRDDRSTRRIDG